MFPPSRFEYHVFYILYLYVKAYGSVRRVVLYNILIEFGVPMNLLRLIKMFERNV
jgi:hypothetical protein